VDPVSVACGEDWGRRWEGRGGEGRGRRKGIWVYGDVPSLVDVTSLITAVLALYCEVLEAGEAALEGWLVC
jgi:hypothetical protein